MDIEIKEGKHGKVHSSVRAYTEAMEARNAAQKEGLEFQSLDAIKKLATRVTQLEKQMQTLREQMDELEARR